MSDPMVGSKNTFIRQNDYDMLIAGVASMSEFAAVQALSEQAFIISTTQTPTGATDVFLYIKNLIATELVIDKIVIVAAAGDVVTVGLGATGTAGGVIAANTPANATCGSTVTLPATSVYVVDSVDITGLTPVTTAMLLTVSTTPAIYDLTETPLVLAENGVLHLSAATGTAEITAILFCHQRPVAMLG